MDSNGLSFSRTSLAEELQPSELAWIETSQLNEQTALQPVPSDASSLTPTPKQARWL